MLGALEARAVDEPLTGQVWLPRKSGKLLMDCALYETVMDRWSPESTTLIVGTGVVDRPARFAFAANTAAAVAWTTLGSVCVSIAGLTAAIAAASAAASSCSRLRKACV